MVTKKHQIILLPTIKEVDNSPLDDHSLYKGGGVHPPCFFGRREHKHFSRHKTCKSRRTPRPPISQQVRSRAEERLAPPNASRRRTPPAYAGAGARHANARRSAVMASHFQPRWIGGSLQNREMESFDSGRSLQGVGDPLVQKDLAICHACGRTR